MPCSCVLFCSGTPTHHHVLYRKRQCEKPHQYITTCKLLLLPGSKLSITILFNCTSCLEWNDSVIFFASSSACWVILFIDFDRFARCVFIFLCGVVWVLVHVCAYFGWRSSATIRALYNLSYHPKQLHLVREIGIYYCIYFFNHLQSWKIFVPQQIVRLWLPNKIMPAVTLVPIYTRPVHCRPQGWLANHNTNLFFFIIPFK